MSNRIVLAIVMLVSYGVGFAAIRWTVGLLTPARPAPEGMPLLLAGIPLLLCLLFEWATGLWDRTPGTLGLGGLTAALPLLLAGALAAVAVLLLRGFGPELAAGFTRDQLGAAITAWGLATIGVAAVALALWRFWPEPTPRPF